MATSSPLYSLLVPYSLAVASPRLYRSLDAPMAILRPSARLAPKPSGCVQPRRVEKQAGNSSSRNTMDQLVQRKKFLLAKKAYQTVAVSIAVC